MVSLQDFVPPSIWELQKKKDGSCPLGLILQMFLISSQGFLLLRRDWRPLIWICSITSVLWLFGAYHIWLSHDGAVLFYYNPSFNLLAKRVGPDLPLSAHFLYPHPCDYHIGVQCQYKEFTVRSASLWKAHIQKTNIYLESVWNSELFSNWGGGSFHILV